MIDLLDYLSPVWRMSPKQSIPLTKYIALPPQDFYTYALTSLVAIPTHLSLRHILEQAEAQRYTVILQICCSSKDTILLRVLHFISCSTVSSYSRLTHVDAAQVTNYKYG